MTMIFEIVSVILQLLQVIEYIVRLFGLIWPGNNSEEL
jgi:hypothetical protein